MNIKKSNGNIENFGGRKFIAFLSCLAFFIFIFIIMCMRDWLTAEYCLSFISSTIILASIFTGANILAKLINQVTFKGGI